MPDPMRALRGATSIGPDPNVPSREGLTGLFNWLVSLGVPIYPEQEVTPLDLAAAVPPLKGLKSLAALAKTEKAAEAAADVAKGIRAYHGSPHSFEKFDVNKIGTGEGAQAFGHGLYFAEAEDTAQYYKNSLSRGFEYAGQPVDPRTPLGRDLDFVGPLRSDERLEEVLPRRIKELRDHAASMRKYPDYNHGADAIYDRAADRLSQLDPNQLKKSGHMYEVNIKADPEHFLDWDQPLSAQSETVQQAVAQAYGDVRPVRRPDGTYSITSVDPDGSGRMLDYGFREPTPEAALAKFREAVLQQPGNLAYRELAAGGNAPKASEALKRAGIPGIKFLDAGSRAAGEGSRNYALFNDALVDILRKYGWLPPVAGMSALSRLGSRSSETR